MITIPKIFSEKDTIYHYTKASTAVEFILFKKKLRLSSRTKSNDPIERVGFSTGRSFYGTDDKIFRDMFDKNEDSAKIIEKEIDRKVENAKQICFCVNHYSKETKLGNPISKDDYGFLKPRMWDQYGENYKGVCLAFSKEKILENKVIDYSRKIDYVNYDNIEQNFNSIDFNSLDAIGFDQYNKNVQKRIVDTFFKKHKDYKNENEYRLLNFSDNKFDYLNIKKALKGIIISPSLIDNEFIVERLKNYSKELNVELLYLDWDKNGISLLSEKFFTQIENTSR